MKEGGQDDQSARVDALEMAFGPRITSEGIWSNRIEVLKKLSTISKWLLRNHGIQYSMSGVVKCLDRAQMESFFASLKKELVHHEDYQTREEAKASLFEYVEVFYNNQRLHSSLGFTTPVAFEQAA